MTNLTLYLIVAGGVAISVALPLLRAALPKPPAPLSTTPSSWWAVARPYLVTALFSLVVALLVMAFTDELIVGWKSALLAGYTADSTLQKMTTGNRAPAAGNG